MTDKEPQGDVAEAIEKLSRDIHYQKDMDNNYMDCIEISYVEILITAAKENETLRAQLAGVEGLVKALNKINKREMGYAGNIAGGALTAWEARGEK